MARIRIQDETREITETQAIRDFLEPFGIWYEKWPVEGRIGHAAVDVTSGEAGVGAQVLTTGATPRALAVGPPEPRHANPRARCAHGRERLSRWCRPASGSAARGGSAASTMPTI